MSNTIGLFTAAPQSGPQVQPMADPTMPNMPAQQGSSYGGINAQTIQQLAKILGNGNGMGPPAQPVGSPLGNGQDTSQLNSQGYPVGGTAQQQNINNFLQTPPAQQQAANSFMQNPQGVPFNLFGSSGGQ